MLNDEQVEQTAAFQDSANAAQVVEIKSDVEPAFMGSVSSAASSVSSISIAQGCSVAIGSIVGVTQNISIEVQHNASLNFMGNTYGEGSYVLRSDGAMHLVADSSYASAAASGSDLS